MESMIKKGITACICIAQFHLAGAQSMQPNNNICLAELKKAYLHEEDFVKKIISANKCWYMSYTLTSQVWNKAEKKYVPVTTREEIMATKNMRYVKSEEIEMYMDAKEVFTINKTQNVVMRTQAVKGALDFRKGAYMNIFNDSVLKYYHVTSCKNVRDSVKGNLIRYDMAPVNNVDYPVQLLSYYFDESTSALKKIHVEYNPRFSTQAKEYTMIIHNNVERKIDDSWVPVRKRVLDGKGKLKPPYNRFHYKDMVIKK